MRVNLLCVGGVRGSLAQPIGEFEDRARRYWRLEVTEVEAGLGRGRKGPRDAVLGAEEERLLARLPDGGEVLALTREGESLDSRGLANFLAGCGVRSVPQVTFLIGGAFGLGEGVLRRATRRLTLSSFTLPHELARLVLGEQLYRAGTILRNEPYHKGA